MYFSSLSAVAVSTLHMGYDTNDPETFPWLGSCVCVWGGGFTGRDLALPHSFSLMPLRVVATSDCTLQFHECGVTGGSLAHVLFDPFLGISRGLQEMS